MIRRFAKTVEQICERRCDMKYILYFMSWYGIYNTLMRVWQFAEEAELGYTITTRVDTVICFVVSALVFCVLVIFEILEEV